MTRKQCMVFTTLLVLLVPTLGLTKAPVVGQPAPDFAVTTFDGKKLSLADFKDQVLIINFWATWCTPCKKELPLLDGYFAFQQIHGLRVVAVTTEDSAPLKLLQPLAAAVRFPMARSMRGPYRVMTGVPTNYVIDRRGILRYAKAGAFDLDALNEILVPLLSEEPTNEQSAGVPSNSSAGTDSGALGADRSLIQKPDVSERSKGS
jgi:cytochrome c biogenesis protein CcmG, thiol:disulfide interchange protein DsbE